MLLEGIETLLALSKAKTMSRTGSQLYISQSAVSKRIANLEKKLGKKLIVPDGRNVQLTQDALNLIESIGPTFNELRGRIYEQQSMEEQSTISVDCSETLVASYLADILGEHFKSDPYICITTNHTPRIIEHVQSGKAHLGICAGLLPPQHGLKTFHLIDEPFYIVADTPLKQLPSKIITNDLSNTANTYQLKILKSLAMTPVMEMDSYAAAAQLALSGIAPALVPLSVIQTLKIEQQHCHHFEQLQPLYRPLHVCLRASSYKNQRIKTLVDKVVASVAKSENSSLNPS
ncbi:LysR family transcriptional regulator [Vibrio europaeus]|uniref:LysR family transcriptional regulator n=1 Tax=Vibrio europaeus TaxID=300876 RepID=UPI0018A753C8|nr:LysR family transcriptional regulator [Vibrio europaeus]MDC5807644.1 LysR family transcriptional regulator [Vibrio europaeus]MDC5810925.1 LysR family transcriptional regulator [Vibrio europaeus]MDC5824556.1 LysR family transcriptional regulator [Vibrio europaeus]MDC5828178.1 LysR family transcriptional regulator [Vibrio europaeus]MDC5836305.1 LysR family transcriptional regulator [Vibrio europaeus]